MLVREPRQPPPSQRQLHYAPLYRVAPSIPFSREAVCAALAGGADAVPSVPLYREPQPYVHAPPPAAHFGLYSTGGAQQRQPLLLDVAADPPAPQAAMKTRRIDVFRALDFNCRTGTRAAGCMLVVMFLLFVGCMCALLVVIVVRVDGILDTVDVRPLTAQMHGAVATAWNASSNMHIFSAELRETLAEMRAPLMESINSTGQMVANVKHFAQHPAISFSVQPGALLGAAGGTAGGGAAGVG